MPPLSLMALSAAVSPRTCGSTRRLPSGMPCIWIPPNLISVAVTPRSVAPPLPPAGAGAAPAAGVALGAGVPPGEGVAAAVPPLFVGVAAWLVPGAELAAAAREGDEALLGAAEDWLDAGVLGLPAAATGGEDQQAAYGGSHDGR